MIDVDGVGWTVNMLQCCVAMVMVGLVGWIDYLNRMRRVCGGRGYCSWLSQVTSHTSDCMFSIRLLFRVWGRGTEIWVQTCWHSNSICTCNHFLSELLAIPKQRAINQTLIIDRSPLRHVWQRLLPLVCKYYGHYTFFFLYSNSNVLVSVSTVGEWTFSCHYIPRVLGR